MKQIEGEETLELLRSQGECRRAVAAGEIAFDAFFPPRGSTRLAAQAICERCPVKEPCLEFVLQLESYGHGHGVWGGTTVSQRREIATNRRTGAA